RVGRAEVVGEHPIADEPEDPAEEDARSHHHRRSGGAGRGGGQDLGGGGRVERDEGSASRRWRKVVSSWRLWTLRLRSSTCSSRSPGPYRARKGATVSTRSCGLALGRMAVRARASWPSSVSCRRLR